MAQKETEHNSNDKNVILLVLVCFFLSGITGLVYEILWTRMIVKIIGSAPFAVSIILTVFMGGLGLGSYLAGRTIDRVTNPIKLVRIYGLLQLVIGAYGFAVPFLLVAFRPLYAIIYNRLFSYFILYNILTFLGCSILLAVPVICMGATLPVLCRFYVTKLSHLGTHAGRLYGLNTIGAAFGALLCGFWLIRFLGMGGTLALAVLINAVIGAACLLTGFKPNPTQPAQQDADLLSQNEHQKNTQNKTQMLEYPLVVGVLVIFAVSGFCGMAYEVIWTKLLGLIVGPTTYSFTIVLVTFIFGLALGSVLFGSLADRTQKPVRLLILTQFAAALFAMVTSQLMGNSQLFFAKLIFNFQDSFAVLTVLKAIILFGFMILPTLCQGAAFPLVGKIYTQSLSSVGKTIGVAYAINTIGAVLGSFCAGFVLIPLLGKENSLSVVITAQFLASLVVAGVIAAKSSKRIFKLTALATLAVVGLLLSLNFPAWNRRVLAKGKYHRFEEIKLGVNAYGWLETLLHGSKILAAAELGEVVYYGDGVGGFTSVVRYPDALGNFEYSMVISGKVDASSRGDMGTQTLSAHFPMLFHPAAKKIMVLGLASGVTAGETLLYPIERLDVIDISRQVVAASDFFRPWNNNVLAHPKTNLIIQDGRAHLQLTKEKYDVIISEPSNPWMAGLATLFTKDFFELARDRLHTNGIFVQFIHSYQMDWNTFALVGRTFSSVFPNSVFASTTTALTRKGDWLLVGFKDTRRLSFENVMKNFSYAQKSENIKFADARSIYRFVEAENLSELFGPGPLDTDSWPRVEFAAPKVMYYDDPAIVENIRSRAWRSPETTGMIRQITESVDAQIDLAAYAFSLYMPFHNMVDLAKATPSQKQRFFELVETYCARNPIEDYSVIEDDRLRQKCREIQTKIIHNNIHAMPDKTLSYVYLGNLYCREGLLDEAFDNYTKALKIKPDDVDALNNLAAVFLLQDKLDAAVELFNTVLRIRPGYVDAHSNLANALARQGRLDEAVERYNETLRIEPYRISSINNLARLLCAHKQAQFHDPQQAVRLAEQGCRLTGYQNPVLLDTLAMAYASVARFAEAVAAAERASALALSAGQSELATAIQLRLRLYEVRRPYIEQQSEKRNTF